MSLVIPATVAHMGQIIRIANEAFPHRRERLTPNKIIRLCETPGTCILVETPGGGLIRGFMVIEHYDESLQFVAWIAVDSTYQRQGVGSVLLNHIKPPVAAWVWHGNTASQAMFSKAGFTPTKSKERRDWLYFIKDV